MKCKNILYIGNDLSKKSNYQTTQDTLSRLLISEGYSIIKVSDKQNKIFRLLDMCLTLIKNREKIDYVLIDTFSTTAFYFAFITSQIARFFNLKYIPILHGGNLPIRLKKSPKFSKLIFNNSYKNIAPSNYLKHEFEKQNFQVEFIPNILESSLYSFKERKVISPKLLWVRAFKNIYNPKLAIEVIKKIKTSYPNIKLCMIGPIKDNTFNEVQSLVKKYKLEKNIEFTGVLEKKKWLKKSEDFDIFINTTNVDNTPVSVMESMAMGLPVISTNVGGIPYLIEHKIDGVLVEKNNAQQMTEAIIQLIKSKNHINITKNARIKVESFFWEVVKNKWFKVLN